MLPSRALVLALVVSSTACASSGPTQARASAPPAPPMQDTYAFETPEDFETAKPDAMAAMRWLVRTDPRAADATTWKRARDLALDFIEKIPEPKVVAVPAIVGPVENDRRYLYSRYMGLAYLNGKALYTFEHDAARDPVAAELAGIDAMFVLYDVLQASDTDGGRSPKLKKLARKKRAGKLRAYVTKKLGA